MFGQSSAVISFVLFLIVFTAIGVLSVRRRKTTVKDYVVASRDVGPTLAALSAVVTNNSGYMFIGLIGFTYTNGFSAIWLTVGWIAGDALAWWLVHPRVRRASEVADVNTMPTFLALTDTGLRRPLVVASGVVTVVFLATYAAAQLSAGSKALFVLLGWDYAVGAGIGAVMVGLYSFAGGIRASIWTDVAQAAVMFLAMFALLAYGLVEVGDPLTLAGELRAIDASLVSWTPSGLALGLVGFGLYASSWVAAGFGVVGQPHILIRIMSLRSPTDIRRARLTYFAWYVPFSVAAVGVALYARVLLPDVQEFDPELALPRLAQQFMPGVLVGLVLAGLFSATMSTADSQLLTSAAAATQDIPRTRASYATTKLTTLAFALGAAVIAITAPASVFELVIVAWSGLASGLGPLLLVRLLRWPLPTGVGLVMIGTGVATAAAWRFGLQYGNEVYEALPGMLAGAAVYFAAWLLAGRPALNSPRARPWVSLEEQRRAAGEEATARRGDRERRRQRRPTARRR